jgi:hypothetical protein
MQGPGMGLQGPQSFCLSNYEYDNEVLQSLVDGVNMALKMYPDAWIFVLQSGLLIYKYPNLHPVSEKIFNGKSYELEALVIVTQLARKRAGLSY